MTDAVPDLPPPLPESRKRRGIPGGCTVTLIFLATLLLGTAALGIGFWNLFLQLAPFPETDSQEEGSTSPQAIVDAWLTSLHEKGQFNGGVLIARHGKPLFMEFYGTADLEGKTPLTARSAFRLASVSKQFTAMAVLLLSEKGHLSLHDPVTRFLPELPWDGVTIHHLLQHTADLPDYSDIPKGEFSTANPLSFEDVLTYLATEHADLSPSPGREFSYSNTGYVLLATIVQRATGKPFQQAMDELIFKPLAMGDSGVWHLGCAEPDHPTRTEGFSFGSATEPEWRDGIAGDGGVFVSMKDFLKWDRALDRGALISQELWQEALTPPTLPEDNSSDYGFGWIVEERRHWHNGAWLAAATHISRFPDHHALVVVLDNNANRFRVDRIADLLAAVFGFEEGE